MLERERKKCGRVVQLNTETRVWPKRRFKTLKHFAEEPQMADNHAEMEVDLATQSNPTAVVQRHLSLDLEAVFGVQVLRGRCTITAVVVDESRATSEGWSR